MKKSFIFLTAIICLMLASTPADAQLIIRNNGHAEIGVNPFLTDPDTTTVLKLFGNNGQYAAGARITFGDGNNVYIGENGITNSDQLRLHGHNGIYFSESNSVNPGILAFFDPSQSTAFNFNSDVVSHGVLIQWELLKKD